MWGVYAPSQSRRIQPNTLVKQARLILPATTPGGRWLARKLLVNWGSFQSQTKMPRPSPALRPGIGHLGGAELRFLCSVVASAPSWPTSQAKSG